MPFLDAVPFHPHHDLDLYQLKEVMTPYVRSVQSLTPASNIQELLDSCEHNAFAVTNPEGEFLGSIARGSLEVLLQTPTAYGTATEGSTSTLAYSEMANEWSVSHLEGGEVSKEREKQSSARSTKHLLEMLPGALIDLGPYLNSSAYCLPEVFSVKQAYNLFRACGLRHLFVLNQKHHCVGVCTRKDFIGHDMEGRLPKLPNTKFSREYGELRRDV